MKESDCEKHENPSKSLTKKGWVHFAVAAGILFVAAISWNGVLWRLKIALAKLPVPWPDCVQVEGYRLTNFPEKIGPYIIVQDGEFSSKKDGIPDGIDIVREDVLDSLGTTASKYNWYYMATYRDTRVPGTIKEGKGRYVRLEITYYTGLLDAVPHVPERCLFAGGYTIVYEQSGLIPFEVKDPKIAAKLPPRWRRFNLYRTVGARGGEKTAEYFVFSMNGIPTARWEVVRGKLMLFTVRYCYFAKIQIAVFKAGAYRGRVGIVNETDLSISDQACRDFLSHALPDILRFLPSADDVKKLSSSD